MRRAVARPAGTHDLMDDVRDYEHGRLTASRQAALRFTDAFLTDPGGFPAARRTEMLAHFSPDQIVELTFKLMFWTANKPVIAIGLDAPFAPDRLTSFDHDEHGALVPLDD